MERILLPREVHRLVAPDDDLRAFLARVYRMERAGKFPQRVRVGLRRVGWRESELHEWFANLERGIRHERA